MQQAYACRVTVENMPAIASEFGNNEWDLELALHWLEEHEEGWFLRDPTSALDCHFFTSEVFFEMYVFDQHDKGDDQLFRQVVKI